MFKRLAIVLVILGGLLVLADRGLAMVSGNAAAREIRLHEGLKEDPDVEFKGFPFVSQAVRGRFGHVTITARDVERGGFTIDRIDAELEDVKIDLGEAINGEVRAVPVRRGHATARVTYADLSQFLARKPGNIRVVVRGGQVVVVSSFGIPGVGQADIEGTPSVQVSADSVRVVVSNVHVVTGPGTLTAALARTAAARASFTVPFGDLPFGIKVASAKLTPAALVVEASATGLVVDVT